MRCSFTTSLLFILITIGLGCRQKEMLEPLAIPACRIVKATQYTKNRDPNATYDRLTVNGSSFDIYKSRETFFTYDSQGRLIRELTKATAWSTDYVYTYAPASMTAAYTIANKGVVTQTGVNVISLNAQGYDDRYLYDAQGHMLTLKNAVETSKVKWESGNHTYSDSQYNGPGSMLILLLQYDPTHRALPLIYQFQGAISQNLILSDTQIAKGIGWNTKDGPLNRIDYSYGFDTKGRVVRQIGQYTSYPDTGWSFGRDVENLSVTDYEYNCP